MSCLRLLLILALLSGCERLGIEDPVKQAERLEAEGKAIGSACRHAGRALEDCFTLNPTADKAAIFTGWREMNDYMTQNKIESVRPEIPMISVVPKKYRQAEEADTAEQSAPAAAARSGSAPGASAASERLRERLRRAESGSAPAAR
jgi:hypothetical protein